MSTRKKSRRKAASLLTCFQSAICSLLWILAWKITILQGIFIHRGSASKQTFGELVYIWLATVSIPLVGKSTIAVEIVHLSIEKRQSNEVETKFQNFNVESNRTQTRSRTDVNYSVSHS